MKQMTHVTHALKVGYRIYCPFMNLKTFTLNSCLPFASFGQRKKIICQQSDQLPPPPHICECHYSSRAGKG